MHKYCYCTTVSNDRYIPGAIGLYYSLKKVKSRYPFIALVSKNVSEDGINMLKEADIEYRWYDPLATQLKPFMDLCFPMDWSINTCEKINAFFIEDYDKSIFLDADIIVLKNIDEVADNMAPSLQVLYDDSDENNMYFISTYLMVAKPNVISIDDIHNAITAVYEKEKHIFSDENIFPYLFPLEYMRKNGSIINQSDYTTKLYHHINIGSDTKKYWEENNLDTVSKIEDYINNTELEPEVTVSFNDVYDKIGR